MAEYFIEYTIDGGRSSTRHWEGVWYLFHEKTEGPESLV